MKLNSWHKEYLVNATILHSLDRMFQVVDAMEPAFRDEVLMMGFMSVVGMGLDLEGRDPKTTTVSEALTGTVSYRIFKEKCRDLVDSGMSDHYVAATFVLYIIRSAYHLGNTSLLGWFKANFQDLLQDSQAEIDDPDTNPADRELAKQMKEQAEESLAGLDEKLKKDNKAYERLCEEFIKPLIEKPR